MWKMPEELDFILWDCQVEGRIATDSEKAVILEHLRGMVSEIKSDMHDS